MPDLVDLDTVKRHLNETGSERDEDLSLKLLQAEAIILAYLARPSDEEWAETIAGWTDETVPEMVRAAILVKVLELVRFRGDDGGPDAEAGFLSKDIRSLLSSLKTPVVA